MGGLVYVFTTLTQADHELWKGMVGQVTLYLPAAALLSAGAYLLIIAFYMAGTAPADEVIAGIAFLVGLFVNTALAAFEELTERLLGKSNKRKIIIYSKYINYYNIFAE